MKEELKDLFKNAMETARTLPRIAFAGDTGAGKSTSMKELMNDFGGRLYKKNIGHSQTTKIRTDIIPLYKMKDEENACFCISFLDNDGINIGMVMSKFRAELEDQLEEFFKPDGEGFRSTYEKSLAVKIVEGTFKPGAQTYDITGYAGEVRERLIDEVDKLCIGLIDGGGNGPSMPDVPAEGKRNAKKESELKKIISDEIDRRLSVHEDSKNRIENLIMEVLLNIKKSIRDKLKECKKEGMEIEIEDEASLEDLKKAVIYIEASTQDKARDLFQYIYGSDGKDLVISHLTYLMAMSRESVERIDSEKYAFPEIGKASGEMRPLFVAYDLKGLEEANMVDYTIIEIIKGMPDAVLLFRDSGKSAECFNSLCKRLRAKFPMLPVRILFTHIDERIESELHNQEDEVMRCLSECGGDSHNFEEEIKRMIPCVYDNARKQLENALEKYMKGVTVYYCCLERNNLHKHPFAGKEDFDLNIDKYLPEEKKLYKKDRITGILIEFCKSQMRRYKKIPGLDDEARETIKKKIKFSFKKEKLEGMAGAIADGNIKYAGDPSYENGYYLEKDKEPHWMTVYAWCDQHRVGLGYKSYAQVYDNIEIDIFDFISGFIDKKVLRDAIIIDLPEEIDISREEKIIEIFQDNILTDINERFHGFFYSFILSIVYRGFAKEFDNLSGWYKNFSRMIELIYEKLSNVSYIMSAMEDALERYREYFISETL